MISEKHTCNSISKVRPNSFIQFISFIVHETDSVYNHDVEDRNIISVFGSLAIAGQISLLSNAIQHLIPCFISSGYVVSHRQFIFYQ